MVSSERLSGYVRSAYDYLAKHGRVSSGRLGAEIGVTPSRCKLILTKLLDEGLIVSSPTSDGSTSSDSFYQLAPVTSPVTWETTGMTASWGEIPVSGLETVTIRVNGDAVVELDLSRGTTCTWFSRDNPQADGVFAPANAEDAPAGTNVVDGVLNAELNKIRQSALAAIPAVGYIATRWPVTYAADFLRTHPELLPAHVDVALDTGSRDSAGHAIRCWATAVNVAPDALKAVLADAYLVEHHIPLHHANEQRAALLGVTLS